MTSSTAERTVFIVSDGTGITAETFSHSVLSQFEGAKFRSIRLPFVDSREKVLETIERINRCNQDTGFQPLVFSTLVNPEMAELLKNANGFFLDLFGTFVKPLEETLGMKSSHSVGRSHGSGTSKKYRDRIEAINFSLSHDDGQFVHGLDKADVILVGVSRCGKTPTSLYLAMQYALKVANFPLIPEDFERGTLPSTLAPFRKKLFGLSIQPERLSEVRNERRPNSKYAKLEQCRYEVAEAERLMRIESIPFVSTTSRSIEEISTKVLQEVGLEAHIY